MGKRIHGHTQQKGKYVSKTYYSWIAMKQRCLNPKNISYSRYGGKGIKVCKRWLEFKNFLADMGERPVGCTLDRINNSKGYCKENCRWVDKWQQAQNKNSNKEYREFMGMIGIEEASKEAGVPFATVKSRLRAGWTREEALGLVSRRIDPATITLDEGLSQHEKIAELKKAGCKSIDIAKFFGISRQKVWYENKRNPIIIYMPYDPIKESFIKK